MGRTSSREPQSIIHVPSPHRCPLKTLQKCEIALEKLKNDMAVVSGVQAALETMLLGLGTLPGKFLLQGGSGKTVSMGV